MYVYVSHFTPFGVFLPCMLHASIHLTCGVAQCIVRICVCTGPASLPQGQSEPPTPGQRHRMLFMEQTLRSKSRERLNGSFRTSALKSGREHKTFTGLEQFIMSHLGCMKLSVREFKSKEQLCSCLLSCVCF